MPDDNDKYIAVKIALQIHTALQYIYKWSSKFYNYYDFMIFRKVTTTLVVQHVE